MFKRLDEVLPDRLNRLRLHQSSDVGPTLQATDEALGEIWHHAVPMRAIGFRSGTVTVAVISTAWGTEVASREERLLKLVNRRLKKANVKKVRTTVDQARAKSG